MERKEDNKKKEKVPSTSQFIDLFGIKEPPPSSSGALASLLQPPTSAYGKRYRNQRGRGNGQNEHLQGGQAWKSKQISEDDYKNAYYQETRPEPCQFSSSIYYGGQESYTAPPPSQSIGQNTTDMSEDEQSDSGTRGTSRGNWWKGSLYY